MILLSRGWVVGAVVVALPFAAHAQGAEPPSGVRDDAPAPDERLTFGNPQLGTVELSGRALFRTTFTDDNTPWHVRLSLASARLELNYRLQDFLRIKLQAELTSGIPLRDAWARLRIVRGARLQAGRMKAPFSPLVLTSRWTLPIVHRGMIHDQVVKTMGYGGRRTGLSLEWRNKRLFSIAAGLFASGLDSHYLSDGFAEDWVGRADVTPLAGLTVGANVYGHTDARIPGTIKRGIAYGVDVTFDRWGLRAWIESLFGDNLTAASGVPFFAAGRVLAAYRIDLGRQAWAEPFAFAEALDPNVIVRDDAALRLAGGVNVGRGAHYRAQIEIARRMPEPAALFGQETTVSLQLGGAF